MSHGILLANQNAKTVISSEQSQSIFLGKGTIDSFQTYSWDYEPTTYEYIMNSPNVPSGYTPQVFFATYPDTNVLLISIKPIPDTLQWQLRLMSYDSTIPYIYWFDKVNLGKSTDSYGAQVFGPGGETNGDVYFDSGWYSEPLLKLESILELNEPNPNSSIILPSTQSKPACNINSSYWRAKTSTRYEWYFRLALKPNSINSGGDIGSISFEELCVQEYYYYAGTTINDDQQDDNQYRYIPVIDGSYYDNF